MGVLEDNTRFKIKGSLITAREANKDVFACQRALFGSYSPLIQLKRRFAEPFP